MLEGLDFIPRAMENRHGIKKVFMQWYDEICDLERK